MDELKPCPFCGGEAYLTNAVTVEAVGNGCRDTDIVFVECSTCGARGRAFSEDDFTAEQVQRFAVSAWNLRKER